MRQEDPQLLSLLSHMREGAVDDSDVKFVFSRLLDSMDSATLQGSNDIPTEFVEHQPSRLSVEATDASVSVSF